MGVRKGGMDGKKWGEMQGEVGWIHMGFGDEHPNALVAISQRSKCF